MIVYITNNRIHTDGRSNDKDYPDEMVEMVPPFGGKHKTYVNPSRGKKIPRGRDDFKSMIGKTKIFFRPNIRTVKIVASNRNLLKSAKTIKHILNSVNNKILPRYTKLHQHPLNDPRIS